MSERMTLRLSQGERAGMRLKISSSAPHGGTDDYEQLRNRPSIEGCLLEGDRTIQQIGVGTLSVTEIEKILYLG